MRVLPIAGMMLALCCFSLSPMLGAVEVLTDYSQKMKPPTIKILLGDNAEGAIVEVKGRYDIFNPHTQRLIASGTVGKRAALHAKGADIQWEGHVPLVSHMRIVPADAESSILVEGIEYRGCLEIYTSNGSIHLVNEVDIENFLKSTLPLQIGHINNPKILEALAIIARTHVQYLATRNPHNPWQVKAPDCDYLGYGVTLQHLQVDLAIENTKDQILAHKNRPFAATWTENSAGRTATYSSIFRKQVPTPQGVATPLAAKDREKHHWVTTVSKQELAQLTGLSKIAAMSTYLDQQSEKAYAVRISDGILSQDIDFFKLQKRLGADRLRSNDFEVEIKGEKVVFSGWGQGHSVGLCLYSAMQMAEKGDSVATILAQFFPDTRLQILQPGRPLEHNH